MVAYFADTSAIAKLYMPEIGSGWLRSLDLSALSLSALALPELASALGRRQREGVLSDMQARLVWRRFRGDLRTWATIQVNETIVRAAVSTLRDPSLLVPLRTLDALQLASAVEVQRRARRQQVGPIVFLTPDDRLEQAAMHTGLTTDNPNRYP
jgi:predicted nucleic acid-binding protein